MAARAGPARDGGRRLGLRLPVTPSASALSVRLCYGYIAVLITHGRLPLPRSGVTRGHVSVHLEQLRLDAGQLVERPVPREGRRRLPRRYQDRDWVRGCTVDGRSGTGHARGGRASGIERDRDVLVALDQARRPDAERPQVSGDARVITQEADLLLHLVLEHCGLDQQLDAEHDG